MRLASRAALAGVAAAAALRCTSFDSNPGGAQDAGPDASQEDAADAPAADSPSDAPDAAPFDGSPCATDAHYFCADFDEKDARPSTIFKFVSGNVVIDDAASISPSD